MAFSSLTGTYGNAGQGDYAFANRFVDEVMSRRHAESRTGERSGRSVSIAWPLWADGGMAPTPGGSGVFRPELGVLPMPAETGIRVLAQGM